MKCWRGSTQAIELFIENRLYLIYNLPDCYKPVWWCSSTGTLADRKHSCQNLSIPCWHSKFALHFKKKKWHQTNKCTSNLPWQTWKFPQVYSKVLSNHLENMQRTCYVIGGNLSKYTRSILGFVWVPISLFYLQDWFNPGETSLQNFYSSYDSQWLDTLNMDTDKIDECYEIKWITYFYTYHTSLISSHKRN